MEHIKEQLSLAESQISSFDSKRTKISATRARAHLMAVRKACDTMRKDILEQSKAHQAAKRSSGSSVECNPEVIDDTSPDEEEPETSEVSTQTVPVVEDTQQPVVIKLPKKTKKPKTKKR